MGDLRDLYQEVILDHSKKPRNYREMAQLARRAEGYNPLCGDRFVVYVDLKDGVLRDISFQGSGCAISKASASMMTESLKGKTAADSEAVFERFHDLVTGRSKAAQAPPEAGAGKSPEPPSHGGAAHSRSDEANPSRPDEAAPMRPGGEPADLGKLAVFSGVCEFPVRVKCATLAWHTLRAALEQKNDPVTTE